MGGYPSKSWQRHRIFWIAAKHRVSISCGDETDSRSKLANEAITVSGYKDFIFP